MAEIVEKAKSLLRHNYARHLEHIYLAVCMTIMILGTLLISFWLIWPDNIVEVKGKVTVNQTIFHPGDRITYTLSFCKTRQLPGRIYRSLSNSIRITFTEITSDLPVGCHTIHNSDLVIPDFVDSGTYHIEGSGEYQANPLRTFINHWSSENFQIINLDDKPGGTK